MTTIPEGPTHFTIEYGKTFYWKTGTAFGLNVLLYWQDHKQDWKLAGYLPWDQIKPIGELQCSVPLAK